MGITAMSLNRITYLFKEGLRGVFSHGFRSFASVTVIAACLIIMGSFGLVAVNVDNLIGNMEEDSQILAFVDESLSDSDALSIEGAIRSIPNVRDVQFISREEAMENYKNTYGDSTVFENLDASVFRNRYVIRLNDITLMRDTAATVDAVNGVADVNAPVSIAEGFIAVRNVVSVITAILIVILLVVSVFMMSNTIKLATFTRRDEIAVMKMVGASNSFIRTPFVVEGLIPRPARLGHRFPAAVGGVQLHCAEDLGIHRGKSHPGHAVLSADDAAADRVSCHRHSRRRVRRSHGDPQLSEGLILPGLLYLL